MSTYNFNISQNPLAYHVRKIELKRVCMSKAK